MLDYSNPAVWAGFVKEHNLDDSPPPPPSFLQNTPEADHFNSLRTWAHARRYDQSEMLANYAHIIELAEQS